jgi:hypothetical protein
MRPKLWRNLNLEVMWALCPKGRNLDWGTGYGWTAIAKDDLDLAVRLIRGIPEIQTSRSA